MKKLNRVTLEMSLKPFKNTDPAFVEEVCRTLFRQWRGLTDCAEETAVMLWASDGSEILDYNGKMEEPFEWAYLIGGATVKTNWDKVRDPEGLGLHTRSYNYIENPPEMTYGIYRGIIAAIKRVGLEMTGKPVFVGTAFDPGPEFAVSSFKYERHPEILVGDSMGEKSMVCCYARLNADDRAYVAFPEGIPQNTHFGEFLGKQAQIFCEDMGLDFLWLSNGFGFGTETWGSTGALFNGKEFFPEKINETRKQILEFWDIFRGCFTFPLMTRGTNLTAGIDFATDGVDIQTLYKERYDFLPPPNSPWAALDGNFGLELAGYLSRIAELPGESFLFRYYVHDPWWHNSPWIDRYEGKPHDIFLPLALSRVNEKGETANPDYLNILTVDDSRGDMPERCPFELIPHIRKSLKIRPDIPGPLIWVYPFGEYCAEENLEKPFFEDWFYISALNHGLPASSVISTVNFFELIKNNPASCKNNVWITPVPQRGSRTEYTIINALTQGANILLYGSLESAGNELLQALGLSRTAPLYGSFEIYGEAVPKDEDYYFNVKNLACGGLDTILSGEGNTRALAVAGQSGEERVVACVTHSSGLLAWCRGTDCSRNSENSGNSEKDEAAGRVSFPAASLLRIILGYTGHIVEFRKPGKYTKEPVITIHRNCDSLWYSGYCPDTRVEICLGEPLGMPLLIGHEPNLRDGLACYTMPRAWQHECRVFVRQENSGDVYCREVTPVRIDIERRLEIGGLQNAEVYVLTRKNPEKTFLLLNSPYPIYLSDHINPVLENTIYGPALKVSGITGTLSVMDKFIY